MKKIISLITAFVMLTSILTQTAMASFSDVADDNPYKKAITTLTKLSVIDGYDENGTSLFKPENSITRAEFTKLIVFMLGHQNLTYSETSFNDVNESHWAKNYIQTAYNLGIIAGMGDGTFAPDSPVTYEQALKMIVCTLGYQDFAQILGSYPEGYIQQADKLDLTKNINNVLYSSGAPRGVIAQALYNALEIEMYEYNSYKWEKTEKTLLNDYLKVKKVKGTLIGVEDYITEDCKHELLEEEMAILTNDGEEITMNYSTVTKNVTDISKYLGNTITAYYRQPTENSEKTLVIIDDETTKNSQIEINYEDINSFSNNTLKYYETPTKPKTVKFKGNDFTVRYNGKIVSATETITLGDNTYTRDEAMEMWLNPDTDYSIYGNVTLTDSGNDGTIDMIQIYDYETIVAYTTPTTADYRITDKLITGNYLILDPQAPNYTYTITKNGAVIPVTSIASNDVILYAKSLDESMYSLIVTNQTVKGSISSISTSNSKITIGGNSYKIGDKCESYINDKEGKELKTGVSGTFYTDAMGTIVFGTLEQTSVIPYAYIVNAYLDNDEGGKPYITVYSTNASGEPASYPLKDRVKLNGSSINSEVAVDRLIESASYTNDDIDMADDIYGAGKTPVNTDSSQPARVTVKDGIVTEIVTLTSDETQTQNDDKEQIVRCKDLGRYTYSSNGFTQSGRTAFSVNSSTIVLCVPSDRKTKKQYAKKTPSSAFTSGDSYFVEAYDINSSKIAGLVILYGNDNSLTRVKKDTDFSIVAEAPEGIYSEKKDDNVLKLNVFAGSNSVKSWTTYNDTEFADVMPGDVIQFAYDSDQYAQGRINNIKFADVAKVLDGETYNGQKFNWQQEQEPSKENNFQEFKFDYRFKKAGTDVDEVYTSTSLGTVPYSRACVFNVSQILLDEKKLYVTKGGFYENDEGQLQIDDSDYEEIAISSSTKILRMEEDREEISRYAVDTTTDMTINDLRDAKNYGADCSKILLCSLRGVAKLIVVYN